MGFRRTVDMYLCCGPGGQAVPPKLSRPSSLAPLGDAQGRQPSGTSGYQRQTLMSMPTSAPAMPGYNKAPSAAIRPRPMASNRVNARTGVPTALLGTNTVPSLPKAQNFGPGQTEAPFATSANGYSRNSQGGAGDNPLGLSEAKDESGRTSQSSITTGQALRGGLQPSSVPTVHQETYIGRPRVHQTSGVQTLRRQISPPNDTSSKSRTSSNSNTLANRSARSASVPNLASLTGGHRTTAQKMVSAASDARLPLPGAETDGSNVFSGRFQRPLPFGRRASMPASAKTGVIAAPNFKSRHVHELLEASQGPAQMNTLDRRDSMFAPAESTGRLSNDVHPPVKRR